MKKKYIFLITIILCISLLLPVFSIASSYDIVPLGVGNQNSYSGGGGGGSSSSGGYSSGGYDGDSDGGIPIPGYIGFPIIVVFIIVFIVFFSKMKSSSTSTGTFTSMGSANMDINPLVNPVADIQAEDPNFSEPAFLAYANEVFITLNEAWTKRDWKPIRVFESESLFMEHSRQLDEYIRNKTINHLERVAVKDSRIYMYYTDNQYEYIEVKMHTSMIDYVQEEETGKITAGDKTTLWQMMHTLVFMRTKGVKTSEATSEIHATNCPNCGAATEITSQGECSYCHSVITTGEYNWVLCKFTGQNI